MFLKTCSEALINFHGRSQSVTHPPTGSLGDCRTASGIFQGHCVLEMYGTDLKPKVPAGSIHHSTWHIWGQGRLSHEYGNTGTVSGFLSHLLGDFGQMRMPHWSLSKIARVNLRG